MVARFLRDLVRLLRHHVVVRRQPIRDHLLVPRVVLRPARGSVRRVVHLKVQKIEKNRQNWKIEKIKKIPMGHAPPGFSSAPQLLEPPALWSPSRFLPTSSPLQSYQNWEKTRKTGKTAKMAEMGELGGNGKWFTSLFWATLAHFSRNHLIFRTRPQIRLRIRLFLLLELFVGFSVGFSPDFFPDFWLGSSLGFFLSFPPNFHFEFSQWLEFSHLIEIFMS